MFCFFINRMRPAPQKIGFQGKSLKSIRANKSQKMGKSIITSSTHHHPSSSRPKAARMKVFMARHGIPTIHHERFINILAHNPTSLRASTVIKLAARTMNETSDPLDSVVRGIYASFLAKYIANRIAFQETQKKREKACALSTNAILGDDLE